MMHRVMTVVALVALILAVTVLVGCPKKEQASQVPSEGPHMMPGGGKMTGPMHTMPGGEKMEGAKHEETAGKAGDVKAAGDQEMASCLVLGTTMSKDKMIPVEHEGKTYYFCCPPCVDKFKADPEKYIKTPAPPKPAGEGMH